MNTQQTIQYAVLLSKLGYSIASSLICQGYPNRAINNLKRFNAPDWLIANMNYHIKNLHD